MNRKKAIEWFEEVEKLDPGAYFSRKTQHGYPDSSEWRERARKFMIPAEQVIKRTFPPGDPIVATLNNLLSGGIENAVANSGQVSLLVTLFQCSRARWLMALCAA